MCLRSKEQCILLIYQHTRVFGQQKPTADKNEFISQFVFVVMAKLLKALNQLSMGQTSKSIHWVAFKTENRTKSF